MWNTIGKYVWTVSVWAHGHLMVKWLPCCNALTYRATRTLGAAESSGSLATFFSVSILNGGHGCQLWHFRLSLASSTISVWRVGPDCQLYVNSFDSRELLGQIWCIHILEYCMAGCSPIMGPHSLLGIEKHCVTLPTLVLGLAMWLLWPRKCKLMWLAQSI